MKKAIGREKQIKGWLRAKKVLLIEAMNPGWKDLSADWYDTAAKNDSSCHSEERSDEESCPVVPG